MKIPVEYSWRNAWSRTSATVSTIAGLAMVVFVLCASLMLAAGIRRAMLDSGRDDRAIVLSLDAASEDASHLKQTVPSVVAAAPEVARSSGNIPLMAGESLVHLPFLRRGSTASIATLQVRGVSDVVLSLRPNVRIVRGRLARAGTTEAMVGVGLAGRYEGLEVGSTFSLQKGNEITVVGVFAASHSVYESEVWIDGDVLRAALGWEGSFSSVTAQLTSSASFAPFAARLLADKEHGFVVERESAYYTRIGGQSARLISGLGVLVASVFSVAAILGALITMDAAVTQRRREIAVLKALGFGSLEVLLALFLEVGTLALSGAALGAALASLTSWVDFSTTNPTTGQEVMFRFLPNLSTLGIPVLLGIMVGLVGGAIPAIQAARTDPVQAMRD
jgi:putative ABC transport system permease protein